MTVFDIINKRIEEEETEAKKAFEKEGGVDSFKYWYHLQKADGLREALQLFEDEMDRQAEVAAWDSYQNEVRKWRIPQSNLC